MEQRAGGFWQPDANAAQQPSSSAPPPPPSPQPPSQFDGYDLTNQAPQPTPQPQPASSEVSWEASEYIQHDKDAGWFIILAVGALILFGISLVLRQWTFAAVVVAMTAAVVVYAKRPPRLLRYHLSHSGLMVDEQPHPYIDFRSFGVVQEGALYSIRLMPRKRFAPPVAIYFDQQDGEQIVDILASHLPMEQLKDDFIDTVIRKLRF